MADVKIKKGPIIWTPEATEEHKAQAIAAFDKYLVGAGQHLQGGARAALVEKFVEFLTSGNNPERVKKLEVEIEELRHMDKPQRFRTLFYLILMDIFQSGMLFAMDDRAIKNDWDLTKVLGFPSEKKEPTKEA